MKGREGGLIGQSEVVPSWKADIEMAGFKDVLEPQMLKNLSRVLNITRTYAWQLMTGRSAPSEEQASRFSKACQPLIEERRRMGLIKEIKDITE